MNRLFLHLTSGNLCEMVKCYRVNDKVIVRFQLWDSMDDYMTADRENLSPPEYLEVEHEGITDFVEVWL